MGRNGHYTTTTTTKETKLHIKLQLTCFLPSHDKGYGFCLQCEGLGAPSQKTNLLDGVAQFF